VSHVPPHLRNRVPRAAQQPVRPLIVDGYASQHAEAKRVRNFQLVASPDPQSVLLWPGQAADLEDQPITVSLSLTPGQRVSSSELDKVSFNFMLNGGPNDSFYQFPATGQQRTVVAHTVEVVALAPGIAAPIGIRASIGRATSSSNDSGSLVLSYGASYAPIVLPPFVRDFRVWDPVGGGTVQFYDWNDDLLSFYGAPPTSGLEDWHPIPYQAAKIELLTADESNPMNLVLTVRR